MRNTLLLFFILTSLAATAQIKRIALKGGANRPVINDVTNTYTMTTVVPSGTNFGGISQTSATYSEHYHEKTGADISGNIDYMLWRKFFVSTGLGISYTRFKRDGRAAGLNDWQTGHLLPYPYAATGTPMGSLYGNQKPVFNYPVLMTNSENLGKTDLVYVQLPLLAGVSLLKDRLIVRGGATITGLIYASEYKRKYDATARSLYDDRDTSKESFNTVLAGITLNATYYIIPGLGIDVSANKSLTPIYDLDDDGSQKAKMTLLSLGLCYVIVK